MKVAIIGFGAEGASALQYWRSQGAEITICDLQADLVPPEGVSAQLGPEYLANLDRFDLIVRSPGVKPSDIITTKPVTSVTSEFIAKCPAKIIGVTGTKGKGTTSSLIAEMLMKAGKKVWLGGNIGVPALNFLHEVAADDIVVLELSSFQLLDVKRSPHIAVMLMLAVDHLNYHENLEEYHQAKANIYRYQTPDDIAVFNAADPKTTELVALSPAHHIPYGDPAGSHVSGDSIWFQDHRICPTSEVGLIGPHNLENVCAAVAAAWGIIQDPVPIAQAIRAFKGLPHRLELVGEVAGVRYYDDSIATVPENTMAAIRAFNVPKVLILGGSDKGADYTEMARAVTSGNVVHVILIGQTAPAIAEALKQAGYSNFENGPTDMLGIVAAARSAAPNGGVVLLSPACASFGMFTSYKDRGDQFKAAVQNLV